MEELMNILEELRPDVDFEADNLIPENFNSAAAMWNLVQQLQDE